MFQARRFAEPRGRKTHAKPRGIDITHFLIDDAAKASERTVDESLFAFGNPGGDNDIKSYIQSSTFPIQRSGCPRYDPLPPQAVAASGLSAGIPIEENYLNVR